MHRVWLDYCTLRNCLQFGKNISKRRNQIFKIKMSSETIPKDLRQLRACLSCSLVKVSLVIYFFDDWIKWNHFLLRFSQTSDQWENDGCENCEAILNMRGNRDNVYDCTSANFDGMVASCKPDDSWVCKWQRISKFKPGVYAISVTGRLPQQIVRDMVRNLIFCALQFLRITSLFFHFTATSRNGLQI